MNGFHSCSTFAPENKLLSFSSQFQISPLQSMQLHITYIKEIHFKDSHYWKYPTLITKIQQQKHVMAPHDVLVMGWYS